MIYLSRNHRGILLTLLLTFILIEAAPRKPGITDEKSNNQKESGNSDDQGKNAGPEGSGENTGITNDSTIKSGESGAESDDKKLKPPVAIPKTQMSQRKEVLQKNLK